MAKKTGAKKSAAGTKKKFSTIGEMVKSLIVQGIADDEILKSVKKQFPKANTNKSSIHNYRSDMRRKGIKLPVSKTKRASPIRDMVTEFLKKDMSDDEILQTLRKEMPGAKATKTSLYNMRSEMRRKGMKLSDRRYNAGAQSKTGAGKKTGTSSDRLKDLPELYRQMLLVRRFEEKAGQLYGMGLIGGFCHLYIGQEAVVVGVQAALKKVDMVITGYRDHGHMLVCGMKPEGVMAELTGREGGYSRGKGGSMHMFSRKNNFYGGHGIVGAQVPIGAGLAFAANYQKTNAVSVVYFGDGASNQGQVYETFNMAGLWKLPVIFIIENNQYAMGTSVVRSSYQTELYKRGASFNIPGELVDGMDVLAVRDATAEAAKQVRSGKGPFILEMKTYRYRGHSMSDPAKYRKREEVDAVRSASDPIDAAKEKLLKAGIMDDQAMKKIDSEVKAEVAKAAEFARISPEPDPKELWTDIVA